MTRFHDTEMASITGEQVPFSQFADSACLVVNVASA
jgi:glutathione peroxidase-family protein